MCKVNNWVKILKESSPDEISIWLRNLEFYDVVKSQELLEYLLADPDWESVQSQFMVKVDILVKVVIQNN